MSQSPRHTAALKYAAAGIPVLPCKVGAKPPACAHGVKDATCDQATIERWWSEADYNIGLVLESAGLCAIDLDGPEGEAAWIELQIEYGFAPDTREHRTPRGRHLLFKGSLPPTASKLGTKIDTRGRGSFIVAPPSIVEGKQYQVSNALEPVPLPDWIARLLAAPARQENIPSAVSGALVDAAKLREAASYLDANAGYEIWRDMIAGIGAANCPEAREIAHEFSEGKLDRLRRGTPSRYSGPEAVDLVLDTMPAKEGGIGVGTVEHAAHAAGWAGTLAPNIPASERFKEYLSAHTISGEAASTPRNRFDPIFARDFRSLPAATYVVDKLIPAKGISLLYGASGSFKSFLALDILASIAAGLPAFGSFNTVQGDTIMSAGEAPFGIAQKRLPSWALSRGMEGVDDLRFAIVPEVPLVSDIGEIKSFVEKLKASGIQPKIVCFDTVARAMGGLDENEARAAGLMIGGAEFVGSELDCAVLLIAHSGKDESKGIRGSSALFAGVDAVFNVARTKDTLAVKLACEKMKDADPPPDIHLQGQAVAGSLVFSAITADEYAASTRANPPLSQAEVVRALRAAGAINGTEISTNALAVTLAAETAGDPKSIAAIEKRLRRGAEGQLAAYVAGAMGKGSRLRWTFPTLEKQGSKHV